MNLNIISSRSLLKGLAGRPIRSSYLSLHAFSTSTIRCQTISSSNPLRFSVGVGYSSKDTPPFCSREEADKSSLKGFQPNTKIGRWKSEMLALGGGREELFGSKQESKEDDWERVTTGVQDRRRWGAGEDSFFINDSGNYKTFLAVTDGVGGWASEGIDPSVFAESFTYNAYQSTLKNPSIAVKEVIRKGLRGALGDDDVPCGSSTSVVVSLDSSNGVLEAANLGDSGLAILRKDKIAFASASQITGFNAAIQIGKQMKGDKRAIYGGEEQADLADMYKEKLKPGDMVVLFTDGLYDNVFQKHWIALLEHVDKMLDAPENKFLLPLEKEKERARLFADVLVVYGKMMMGREDLVSPFEEEAARYGYKFQGGKIDDITVVTAHVGQD